MRRDFMASNDHAERARPRPACTPLRYGWLVNTGGFYCRSRPPASWRAFHCVLVPLLAGWTRWRSKPVHRLVASVYVEKLSGFAAFLSLGRTDSEPTRLHRPANY